MNGWVIKTAGEGRQGAVCGEIRQQQEPKHRWQQQHREQQQLREWKHVFGLYVFGSMDECLCVLTMRQIFDFVNAWKWRLFPGVFVPQVSVLAATDLQVVYGWIYVWCVSYSVSIVLPVLLSCGSHAKAVQNCDKW